MRRRDGRIGSERNAVRYFEAGQGFVLALSVCGFFPSPRRHALHAKAACGILVRGHREDRRGSQRVHPPAYRDRREIGA